MTRVSPFVSRLRFLVLLAGLAATLPAAADAPGGKRPLNHGDYDGWRTIQGPVLSRDGKFLGYVMMPEEGDGEVVVRNLMTGAEYRHTRGSRPGEPAGGASRRPATPPTAPTGPRGAAAAAPSLTFTADNRYAVFTVAPAKAELDQAKKEKKRPEEMPQNALGIMDLSTGKVERIERVKGFRVPEEAATWLVYQREAKPEAKTEPKKTEEKAADQQPQRGRGARGGARAGQTPTKSEFGSDLVLRNLSDKKERTFADAQEYTVSKDGKSLVYAVASRKPETNGVYAFRPGADGAPAALLAGKGKYSKLSWDEKQTRLAFLSDRDDAAAKQPKFKLYGWDRKAAKAEELVSTAAPQFRRGLVVSDKGAITFSDDGGRVFFGVSTPPEPLKPEGEPPAEDKVLVDLWHWRDDFIQPMQKVRAEQDRNRTFRCVYDFKTKTFRQLADEQVAEITPRPDGRWALGHDDRAYRILVGFDSNYADYYLVNTADGSRKPLMKKHEGFVTWSPGGKYALFFDGKDWNTISIPDGKVTNLTRSLGVPFAHEDHDSPSPAPAHGNGGWTTGDAHVILYDRYDAWLVAPDGSATQNLTAGLGRKEKTQLRYVRLDAEEKAIDLRKPLLFRAENERTRANGFYRITAGAPPQKLLMAAKNFTSPQKAKRADVLVLTASTFHDFPDLLVTGPDFHELKKVSDANPQKAKLLWGKAELVSFKNADGVPLRGLLVKPENFDPAKKYPMLVYIYERLSDQLHHFHNPAPGTSINASYYASNGYLVFMPDIVYTVGYPGQSALKCVLPGIQAVVDKGFVDEKAIGIQGHSWGGYQIAYMITQTNRFRAVAAGAPVANMTSAYDGIRWGTGLPRQFQYERTQSRIGGTLWQYPMRFVENSPVFQADRVQTPLLMLHNDADDAVPWYQGIEYFLALRRLGKEVYLFNYNGELHGLRRRVNQKDYTVRMQQYFDHFLKGAPKPAWMEKGVPFIERDREKAATGAE